jgi:hypothetical protein
MSCLFTLLPLRCLSVSLSCIRHIGSWSALGADHGALRGKRRVSAAGPLPTTGADVSSDLLVFAGDSIVPIDERALRVVSPSPDVQLEECGQVEPVRAADELERLAFEHGWFFMVLQPGSRIHYIFNTHQMQTSTRRLVYQCFWPIGVDLSITHKPKIDVVNAHCSVLGAAHTSKSRKVFGACCRIDIDELPCSLADGFDKFCGTGTLVSHRLEFGIIRRVIACCEKWNSRRNPAQQG